MGYLKGITEINFKTDDEGRTLFYPWGFLGKGYLLPDEAKIEKIKRYKKIYHIITIPCISILAVSILGGCVYCFAIMLIFPLLYFGGTAMLLKGVPFVPDTKLSFKESYENSSKAHNICTLWVMLACSILFTLAGVILIFLDKTSWVIGLICILFFGACSCVFSYMIKVKKARDVRVAS